LVWAHGFGATVGYFDPLLRAWASRGYVVAAPTFPLTHAGAPGGGDYNDYTNQPKDVSFVISQVLADDGPNGKEHPGLVDPSRIAVGGHSLGAVTTRALISNQCCLDARVGAAIEIDGAPLAFPDGNNVQRGVPLLILHGADDQTFPVADGQKRYAEAVRPRYLFVMRNTPHTAFTVPRVRALVTASVSDFLDAYLRGDQSAIQRLVEDAHASGFVSLRYQK
jgi:predicted dienelactone hydrolase